MEIVGWMEPRALILALVLPPLVRVVGHWVPEELFMISMGVLASRADSPLEAAMLLGAVFIGHFCTDQVVFTGGRWLGPRLQRFPRIKKRLDQAASKLSSSPQALFGLIPARVLPLGRAAWMLAAGVVGITWRRFVAIDALALMCHITIWCGLGWWFSNDITSLQVSADLSRIAAIWFATVLVITVSTFLLWRYRATWQLATVRAARRTGQFIRQMVR
jgi:membrane protein DedA with SNARE-associated domain